MTTNQTIDGVPRGRDALVVLVETFRDSLHRGKQPTFSAGDLRFFITEFCELRALLDAPACKRCNGSGWIDNLRPVGTQAMDCPDCKSAAESHTQPVAWRGCNADGEVVTEWIDGVPPERMTDLCGNAARFDKIERAYAEQPAPVAEQLIDRLAQRFPDLENMYTAEVFADWLRAELNPSL